MLMTTSPVFSIATRRTGALMTLCLTIAGIYSQRRMGIPYTMPLANSILAVTMWITSDGESDARYALSHLRTDGWRLAETLEVKPSKVK